MKAEFERRNDKSEKLVDFNPRHRIEEENMFNIVYKMHEASDH